jgi:hypothetical protein
MCSIRAVCDMVICAENAVCTGVNVCTCRPGYTGDGVNLCMPGMSAVWAACPSMSLVRVLTAVDFALFQCVISRGHATAPPQTSASASRPTLANAAQAGSAAVKSASLVCCVVRSHLDGAHRLAFGV